MDIVSLLIVLGLALIAVFFIASPLLDRRRMVVAPGDHHLSSLQAERERVLTALEELEMDHAMGKVEGEDFQDRRKELLAQGAGVLKAIDELNVEEAGSASVEDLDALLEAEVARLRSFARNTSTMRCPRCGEEITERDGFCTRCGEPLHAEVDKT